MEPALQIVLTLAHDGRVGVRAGGPAAASKLSILGLLEIAKAEILKQADQPASPLAFPRGPLAAHN